MSGVAGQLTIHHWGINHYIARDPYTDEVIKGKFGWAGIVELTWNDKQLPFYVNADSRTEERKGELTDLWTRKVLHATAAAIDKPALSAFGETDVTSYLMADDNCPAAKTCDVSLPDEVAERLAEEYGHDQLARRSFDSAVARLKEYVEYLPHSDLTKGHPMLEYISACLAAGMLGYMGGWYREKMSTIRRGIADMEGERTSRILDSSERGKV